MLDDLDVINKFDTGRVAESLAMLPEQIDQVLSDFSAISLTDDYSQIDKVVINGMGGSNIGVWILQSVFAERITKPVILAPGYEVPNFVDEKTLYIFSSYSGNTEEPLSTFNEVKRRGAKMLAIVADGNSKLQQIMESENISGYIFKPTANPANQPRLGTGYSIFGITMLLVKAGIFSIDEEEVKALTDDLKTRNKQFFVANPLENNPAKQLATKLVGKQPILVAAEFLAGNVHAMRNHFCENSKNFASYLVLPELNHYAMEGLVCPSSLKDDILFLFFDSALYHPRISQRSELTKEVVRKNGIEVLNHNLTATTKLEQAFELLQFGMWLTFYLAVLNQVNPVEIPWVDWFKEQLG